MPFTPSHAIVALPFIRTALPAGAVAVGAMAPDLPLFFPWGPGYFVTHGFPSLLWSSVPIALALYAVWRVVFRPAVSGLLPPSLGARLPLAWDHPTRPQHPVKNGLLILVAVLIGVATHVFWDLFTHLGRLGSQWIPSLADQWGPVEGTTWLQHISSAVGLLGVVIWFVIAARRAPKVWRTDRQAVVVIRRVAWIAAPAVLVGAFAIAVALHGVPTNYPELRDLAFTPGTRAGAIILVLALLAAVAVLVLRRLRR
ncbi:MAG: DUF4184 family protein [Pseudolysinimonas sp.]